ncbi:MAG: PAS domain-containing protein [Chloroflexi bacterium]|nr:PAS domain-containing protein [Chloroflexota bacterium]
MLGLLFMVIQALALVIVFSDEKVLSWTLIGAGLVFCLYIYRELRLGHVRRASIVLIGFYWFVAAIVVAVSGEGMTIAASLFIGVVAMAALFLGARASILVLLLTMLYGLVIIVTKEHLLELPEAFGYRGFDSWIVFEHALLLVAIPVITMVGSMADALKEAEAQLAERERAERSLRESEERYRLVSTMIWDYAYAFDVTPEGRLIPAWVTAESFGRLTGYADQDAWQNIGTTFGLYHVDDVERARQDVARTIQGEEITADYRIVRPNGEVRWIRLQRKPIWDAAERRVIRFVGATQDITDQKEADRMRMEMALQEERQKAYKTVISGVSHDIKTPLTVINTSLYTLEKSESQQVKQQHVANIRRQTRRVREYIEDLLAVSRMESAPQLRLSEIGLPELLEGIREELRPVAEDKMQILSLFLPGTPLALQADEMLLRRAFVNLIQNAIAYTPSGGHIQVILGAESDRVLIEIRDDGVGISQTDLEHIFEPFYRGEIAAARGSSGTGLGLAVVQQVIARHNGRIEVRSENHQGTVFRIWLPVRSGAEMAGAPPERDSSTATQELPSARSATSGASVFAAMAAEDAATSRAALDDTYDETGPAYC